MKSSKRTAVFVQIEDKWNFSSKGLDGKLRGVGGDHRDAFAGERVSHNIDGSSGKRPSAEFDKRFVAPKSRRSAADKDECFYHLHRVFSDFSFRAFRVFRGPSV